MIVLLIIIINVLAVIVPSVIVLHGAHKRRRALAENDRRTAAQMPNPTRIKELEAWNQTFSETLDYDKAEQAGQAVRRRATWEALPDSRPLPDGTEIRGNAADDRWYTAEGVQVALAGPTGYATLADAVSAKRDDGNAIESIKRIAKQGDLQSLKNAKAAIVMHMRHLADVAAVENNRRFTESEEAAWINLNAQLDHYIKTIEAIFDKPKPQSDMIGAGRIIQAFAKLDPAGTPPCVKTSEEMIRCYWKRRAELIAQGRSVPMPEPRFHDAQLNLITDVEPEKHYGYAVDTRVPNWNHVFVPERHEPVMQIADELAVQYWVTAKFADQDNSITTKHYGPYPTQTTALLTMDRITNGTVGWTHGARWLVEQPTIRQGLGRVRLPTEP